ncbi:MAG: tetratricopeptide repeat protein [Inquilinus sp.]|uniref:tetratricopeptide repeat protein n=1 Tax=Inquilinus sp. TaxID=1932117 RepID=UPI003F3C7004
MRSRWIVVAISIFPILVSFDSPGHAQQAQFLKFAITKALPLGRSFTFDIIGGIAGNWVYDALPDSFKPSTEGTDPKPDTPIDGSIFQNKCLTITCTSLNQNWFKLDQQWASRPKIEAPAPPADCDQGMDGMTALKRAVAFDSGTRSWPRNAGAAAACYYVAARQQIPIAQYDLSDMLLQGDDGVPADRDLGLGWMEQAAVNGFVPAQTRLAAALEEKGGPSDLEQAARWYEAAARAGDAYAQYQIARFNYYGLANRPKNYYWAFVWLDLSLRHGFTDGAPVMDALLETIRSDAGARVPGALHLMGLAYGMGVPDRISSDLRQAYLYLRDARQLGYQDQQDVLNQLCDGAPQVCN